MYGIFLYLDSTSEDGSPQIVWSLYFQQKINVGGQSSSAPSNVILVPGPGPEIDIDHAVTIVSIYRERLLMCIKINIKKIIFDFCVEVNVRAGNALKLRSLMIQCQRIIC